MSARPASSAEKPPVSDRPAPGRRRVLFALAAPLLVVFLKGCLLGLAITGVVVVLDDLLAWDRF